MRNSYIFCISSEFYDFIKRKECNPNHIWQIREIISGSWNYTLLALNQNVWDSAFDKQYLSKIFHYQKEELDKVNERELHGDDYPQYLKQIDDLIHEKFS